MNIEEAKRIPLLSLAVRLNMRHDAKKSKANDQWFFSPFRQEHDSSFHINTTKNRWYDFGEGKGGDIVNLVCQLQNKTPSEALAWLQTNEPNSVHTRRIAKEFTPSNERTVAKIIGINHRITHPALLQYLQQRSIQPDGLGTELLKEIYLKKKDKLYFGIGFPNRRGGYEIRNKFQKFSAGSKSYSLIKSSKPNAPVTVFEGFLDYISALQYQLIRPHQSEDIVLNALTMTGEAIRLIQKEYPGRLVSLYLDNDSRGNQFSKLLMNELKSSGIKVQDMRYKYAQFKDINLMVAAGAKQKSQNQRSLKSSLK